MPFVKSLTKAYIGDLVGGIDGADVPANLVALANGQSLQDRLFTADSGAGDTAYRAEAANYFTGTITHTDAAATNQYLTLSSYTASGDTGSRYYWNDTTSSKGVRYIAEIDPVTDKELYNVINLDLGQSDGVNASFPHTKAAYKTYYKEFLAQLKSDFPNATIFMNILNRTVLSGDFDSSYNIVRQAQLEIISEVSYVVKGIDDYDLPMVDNFHLTQAGAEEYAEREARINAKELGYSVSGASGAYISGLQLKTDRVEFTVNHDAGDDWTAPSASGGMELEVDGSAAGISEVVKVSSTKGQILFPEGEAPLAGEVVTGFVNYGDGGALGSTPSVAIDNAANAMPFQSAANLTVTSGDPLADLDNVRFRIHARGSAKTYSSGNTVDTVAAIDGTGFSEYVAGQAPEFTDDYLRFTDNTDRLLLDSDFTAGAVCSIMICGELPSSLPTFGVIGGFARTAGTSDNDCRLITQNNTMSFQSNSLPSVEIFATGLTGGDRFAVLLRFNGADDAEAFYNSTTAGASFDPRDDYTIFERWAFGNATNQSGFVLDYKLFDAAMTGDAITDEEWSNILSFWNSQFSLGL